MSQVTVPARTLVSADQKETVADYLYAFTHRLPLRVPDMNRPEFNAEVEVSIKSVHFGDDWFVFEFEEVT